MEVETKGFRIDLNHAQWFKSTRSGPNCDNCVEVAYVTGAVHEASKDVWSLPLKSTVTGLVCQVPKSGSRSSAAIW